MRFTGVDGDINIATSHPEFSAWRWADPGDVPRLIIPFKRAIYERVVEEFRPYWERRK
jgi:putative (di)nucleoside polyphosphate hydrolase